LHGLELNRTVMNELFSCPVHTETLVW